MFRKPCKNIMWSYVDVTVIICQISISMYAIAIELRGSDREKVGLEKPFVKCVNVCKNRLIM